MKTFKQIRGNLSEGWIAGQPKEGKWVGKVIKHDGGIVKVKSENGPHVVVHNGLNEYPIKKSDVTSFHQKDHLHLAVNNEQVELIDEISKKVIGSYKEKAISSVKQLGDIAGTEPTIQQYEKNKHTYEKRVKGIKQANSKLSEDSILEANRKKTLGVIRGKTATGQRANPIDVEPTLKLKGKTMAQLRKGGQ